MWSISTHNVFSETLGNYVQDCTHTGIMKLSDFWFLVEIYVLSLREYKLKKLKLYFFYSLEEFKVNVGEATLFSQIVSKYVAAWCLDCPYLPWLMRPGYIRFGWTQNPAGCLENDSLSDGFEPIHPALEANVLTTAASKLPNTKFPLLKLWYLPVPNLLISNVKLNRLVTDISYWSEH